MRHLIIRNFGPISEIDINLKRVNVIIGPQSSGKSTVLKVACFCDWMERQIEISQDPDYYCNPSFFVKNLVTFHKLEGFMQENTYIYLMLMMLYLLNMMPKKEIVSFLGDEEIEDGIISGQKLLIFLQKEIS